MAKGNGKPKQEGALSRAERIAPQRKSLPDQPGVYLFYDRGGQLLYVGKARSIRKRISSHFSRGDTPLTPRTGRDQPLATPNPAQPPRPDPRLLKRHPPRP